MENTNNSLAYRQVEVIRKNLLAVFRFAVKALIDKACFCSIDDGCEEFVNFCAAMEHILQHRLRPSKAWYLGDDRSHFWFFIKAACHRQDLRSCITNIDNIENIKSPVAKGRAFVRCALMEKRLSEYLGEALKQTNITRRFYKPGAIMLGEEATELCGTLLGLNSIDFGFCIKGENYDTVECPLAISYTPFMKFKQSSLASEDGQEGQDTPPPTSTSSSSTSDPWPQRYNALHKRYMRVLEQKSFLEEVTASQEKALQAAAAAQQEVGRVQREAAFQKQQYEGVILELQAQVTRMKTVHEALQRQLMSVRGARVPLVEMMDRGRSRGGERERESGGGGGGGQGGGGGGGEASRFAAAMGHKLESDRHSLTSSCDRGSMGRPSADNRSLASALSENSVDVLAQGQATSSRTAGEDTQSMVPLTGSLGDLNLDLEPGTAVSESSGVTNPEQATPVVTISVGAYTSSFGEINGNSGGSVDNVHLREPPVRAATAAAPGIQVTQYGEGDDGDHIVDVPSPQPGESTHSPPTLPTHAESRESSGHSCEEDTPSTTATESERPRGHEPTSTQETTGLQLLLTSLTEPRQESENISDHQSEGSGGMSEPEELVPESSSGGEGECSAGDPDSQDPEVLSHMTSSKESALSSNDNASEPEVLMQEEEDGTVERENLRSESNILNQEAVALASPPQHTPDKDDTSDPEILGEENVNRETTVDATLADETSSSVTQGATSPTEVIISSDREEASEPEILTQDDSTDTDTAGDKTTEQETEQAKDKLP
ncbi:uncharacterized protein LOC143276713 isoform X2 [Babylonia areolata]|uniref:uncharacterized protein LOC143276713 isoform X2 n=1 Tax=Babylonia areolata TaxID=304850 RepID=UPI003FD6A507